MTATERRCDATSPHSPYVIIPLELYTERNDDLMNKNLFWLLNWIENINKPSCAVRRPFQRLFSIRTQYWYCVLMLKSLFTLEGQNHRSHDWTHHFFDPGHSAMGGTKPETKLLFPAIISRTYMQRQFQVVWVIDCWKEWKCLNGQQQQQQWPLVQNITSGLFLKSNKAGRSIMWWQHTLGIMCWPWRHRLLLGLRSPPQKPWDHSVPLITLQIEEMKRLCVCVLSYRETKKNWEWKPSKLLNSSAGLSVREREDNLTDV